MVIIQQTRNLQSLLKYAGPIRLINVGVTKSYSVYAPSFKLPRVTKQEQALMKETGEAEQLAHVPIRPAWLDQTSSEFYDPITNKFINYIMRQGKKTLARSLMEHAFEKIKRMQIERYHKTPEEKRSSIILDPREILHKAVQNATPVMELKSIKKGGSTYQVPVPILEKRQRFLAMNWLIQMAQDKTKDISFHDLLAKELLDAANNHGRVIKKKQDLHKLCEANRAYAHYRWT